MNGFNYYYGIFNCNLSENDTCMAFVSEMSNKGNELPGWGEKTCFKEPFQSFCTDTELVFTIPPPYLSGILHSLSIFSNSNYHPNITKDHLVNKELRSIWADIPMAPINLWNVPGVYLFFPAFLNFPGLLLPPSLTILKSANGGKTRMILYFQISLIIGYFIYTVFNWIHVEGYPLS